MTLPITWRINLKPGADQGVNPRQFCFSRKCVGIGWRAGDEPCLEWNAYADLAKRKYANDNGWWPAINALKNRMAVNDLCWTRDTKGVYYLGRISGPWRYVATLEHRMADIVNFRSCVWLRVGPVDAVPGKVVNSFNPSRTLQAVDDVTIRLFSAYYYNVHSNDGFAYSIPSMSADIFSLISSEDCEDIVSLYMQFEGYALIASTCKRSTTAYEFVMRHRETGQRAIAQVKNGYDNLDAERYADFPGTVFLFTSRGHYLGSSPQNVVCLDQSELLRFVHKHQSVLPERIRLWLDVSEMISRIGGSVEAGIRA